MHPSAQNLSTVQQRARRQLSLREQDQRRHQELAAGFGESWTRLRSFQAGMPGKAPASTLPKEEVDRVLERKAGWQQAARDYLLACFGVDEQRIARPSIGPNDTERLERIALARCTLKLEGSPTASARVKQIAQMLARGPLLPALSARLVTGGEGHLLAAASRIAATHLLVARGALLHCPGLTIPKELFFGRLRELIGLGRPWREDAATSWLQLKCPHDVAIPYRDVEMLYALEALDGGMPLDCSCSRSTLTEDVVTLYQQVTLNLLTLQNWRELRHERQACLSRVLKNLLLRESSLRRCEVINYAFMLVQHEPACWTSDEMWAFYDTLAPLLSPSARSHVQGWCLVHGLRAEQRDVLDRLEQRDCDFAALRAAVPGYGVAGPLMGDTAIHAVCRHTDETWGLELLERLLLKGAPPFALRRDYECDLAGRGDEFEQAIAIAARRGHRRIVALLAAQERNFDDMAKRFLQRGFAVQAQLEALKSSEASDCALLDERLVELNVKVCAWLLEDAALTDEPAMRRGIQLLIGGQILLLNDLDHYHFVTKRSHRARDDEPRREEDVELAVERASREEIALYLAGLSMLMPLLLELGEPKRLAHTHSGDRAVMTAETFMTEMANRIVHWSLPQLTQLWFTSGAAAALLLTDCGYEVSPHERSTLAALLLEHKSRVRSRRRASDAPSTADLQLFDQLTAVDALCTQPQVIPRLVLAGITFGADVWLKNFCAQLRARNVPLFFNSRMAQRVCLRIAVARQPKLVEWLLGLIDEDIVAAECSTADEEGDTLIHHLVRLPQHLGEQVCAKISAAALSCASAQENVSGMTPSYEAIASGRPALFARLSGAKDAAAAWAGCDGPRLLAALEHNAARGLEPLLAYAAAEPQVAKALAPLLAQLMPRLVEQGLTSQVESLAALCPSVSWPAVAAASSAQAAAGRIASRASAARLPQQLSRALDDALKATSAASLEAAVAYVADCLELEPLAQEEGETCALAQERVWELLRRVACWQSPGLGSHFDAHHPRKSLAALKARAQRLGRHGAFRFGKLDAIALVFARRRALAAAEEAYHSGLLRWAPWVCTQTLRDAPGGEGFAYRDGCLVAYRHARQVRFVFAERKGAPWIVSAYPTATDAECVAEEPHRSLVEVAATFSASM